MTEHLAMDYQEAGSGTTILFVPGSCSRGAAWKHPDQQHPKDEGDRGDRDA